MTLNEAVGDVMRDIRKQSNVEQRSMAKALKISAPQLCRLESGEKQITMNMLDLFCAITGKPPDVIMKIAATRMINNQSKQPEANQ